MRYRKYQLVPLMILNGVYRPLFCDFTDSVALGANYVKVVDVRPLHVLLQENYSPRNKFAAICDLW